MSADQTVEIPNQPGLNIDLTRMREAALHAQVHGAVFKADGSQVRQVLDYLHERTLEIKRLNARIADLEAQLAQPSREQINKWLEVHNLMTIDPDVWRAAQQERKPLTVAALDTRPVVSDDELAKAFAGTNFGGADHRQELHVAALKKASGYHCGHTITTIMRELRLIDVSGLPTKKGRKLISLAYHALMVGGP